MVVSGSEWWGLSEGGCMGAFVDTHIVTVLLAFIVGIEIDVASTAVWFTAACADIGWP